MIVLKVGSGKQRLASFTLIEMLVVIAIIGILAALVLAAGNGVMKKAMRSRASAEIQAMGTALESYKTDNGIYPQDSTLTTNTYTSVSVASTGPSTYQVPAGTLYTALSGQTNFNDTPLSAGKSYMIFKANQVGNITGTGTSPGMTSYVHDPWNYPYGYSTGSGAKVPYSGTNFYDLWSTAGLSGAAQANTAPWLANWTQ